MSTLFFDLLFIISLNKNKMHVQRILYLLLLLCIPFGLVAQQQLKLQNESGKPIAFAHVQLTGNKGKQVATTSNEQGMVTFTKLVYPIQVQVQHLNFQKWEGVLIEGDELVIQLKGITQALSEVVVTGQYVPQAGELSVQKVRVVNKERIAALGTNQLEDVLRQELNIRFTQDMALGVANISLQGLDGQSVKILIDGTPVGGRQGTGNEVDLNQINPQMIERIEIIEGPMAVSYGADALAGVINIITKKDIQHVIEANASWQEGTVGNEYGKEKGLRDVSLDVGTQLKPNLMARANVRSYTFNGWKGNETGRAKQWLPKDQLFLGALLRYTRPKWEAYYRVDYLDETLRDLDDAFEEEQGRLVAFDQEYLVNRWMHQAQATYRPSTTTRLHALASFTDFSRLSRTTLVTTDDDKRLVPGSESETWYQTWNIRVTAGKQELTDWLSAEIGTDINLETGGGGRILEGEQSWSDVAFFASSEIAVTELFSIRPGVRWAQNSNYDVPVTPSLRLKYGNNKLVTRLSFARGFRAPSLRELFFFFKDTNHDIIGNANLTPESSINLSAQVGVNAIQWKDWQIDLSTDVFYNDVDDKIALATLEGQTSLTYLNIDRYKTLGGRVQANLEKGNLTGQLGMVYTGFYNRYAETAAAADQTFYYYPELNASIGYRFEKLGLAVNGFYKYYGKLPTVQLNDANEPYLAHINPYHWLDLTFQKQVLKEAGSITFGIRNLFDIQQISNSILSSGSAHGAGGGSSAVANGRSYFLRLTYQFQHQKKAKK